MSKGAQTKLLAVMAAAIMVGCVLYAAMPQEEVHESDAIMGWDDVAFLLLLALVMGAATGYAIKQIKMANPNAQQQTRNDETTSVVDSVYVGMQYYENTLRNYCQLWALTDEHWIRQAELATSFSWAKDLPLDITKVLTDSGVYLNSSQMLTNATAEVNVHIKSLSDRLALYNADTTGTYANKMSMAWSYGTNNLASKTAFGGLIGGLIAPTSEYKKAYISGTGVNDKAMYVFGGAGTIKSASGTVYNLAEGYNDLSAITGFKPGVYEFQSDRQYLSGSLLRVSDPAACAVKAGMMIRAGDATKLATFKAGSSLAESKVIIDGVQYDDLKYSLTPDGGTTASQSVKQGLFGIQSMIAEINRTTSHAVSSAAAVHNIYTRAGQASAYITTLTVPSTYHNVEMSTEQKTLLTILSLEQLSKYWQESGGKIKTGEYKMTDGSMQLYCRGDIYDKAGTTKLYSNVVFSPYYYQHGITLQEGINIPDQYCIAGVWAQGVSALSGWSSASIDKMAVVALDAGQKIDIYEMYFDGAPVTSKALEVTAVNIIDPTVIDPNPLPPPKPTEPKETNWVQVIMYIVGAMLLMLGLYSRQPTFLIVGVIVIGLGYVAGDLINDLVMGKSLWHWAIGGAP